MNMSWIKVFKGAVIAGFLVGLLTVATIGILQSCATVQDYDSSSGTLKETTSKVPFYKVDDHYDEMLQAMKAGKKIKVIWIKKENPIAAWTLGAGMIIGGALIVIGIAMIALSQGSRLWRGLMISGAGIGSFLTFYLLEKYLMWACIGFAGILIGAAIYFYCFARGTIDKTIETNDLQKGGEWTEEMGEKAKKLQGSLQDVISRRVKAVQKRKKETS